jgi:tetratricopeptide (TPR) repeat protein
LLLLGGTLAWAGQEPPKPPAEPQQPVAEPEEEDAVSKPKEYTLNPIQALNEMKVGQFYVKQGKYRAAAGRFQEAVNWNPGLADAWFLLGESKEKLNDRKGARAAYEKYVETAPDGKNAKEAKKRVEKLGGKG